MKYILMFALLVPMSIFANNDEDDKGGDEGGNIENIANSDDLNLSDNASDSFLWSYPTLAYPYSASYLGAYYPSYFGSYYNPYSYACLSDFYGVPNYGSSVVWPQVGAALVGGAQTLPQGIMQHGNDGHMMHKGHHPMMHKKAAADKDSNEDMPMMHKKDASNDKDEAADKE